jgi:maltose O-acetyltransferase
VRSLLLLIERLSNAMALRWTRLHMRWTLGSVGPRCVFGRRLKFYGKPAIHLGEHVVINDGVTLQSCDGASLRIGDRVVLSYECMVLTGNLDRLEGGSSMGHLTAPVTIEDDVWIGARCVVLPGVTIGRQTTIAAGAVVASDIPAQCVAGGVPARVIRQHEIEARP